MHKKILYNFLQNFFKFLSNKYLFLLLYKKCQTSAKFFWSKIMNDNYFNGSQGFTEKSKFNSE